MMRAVHSVAVALCLSLLASAPAAAAPASVHLTLKDAIRMAAAKNLDVKAELYTPAAAEATLAGNRGIYNPQLFLTTNYQDANTLPTNLVTTGGISVSRVKTLELNAGVSKQLSSGANVGLSLDNTWEKNNYLSNSLHDYWQSALTLSVAQPLLKNFGREATEINISVARFAREGSLEQFKQKLIDVIAQVRTAYFTLYNLRQELVVQKTSLKLAEKILSDTRAEVKAGVLPAMEVLNAEYGLALRQRELNVAEQAVRDQEDVLRQLLQLPESGEILPADIPSQAPYPLDEKAEIARALAERPDLQALQTSLASNRLQTQVARNQMLPDLTLSASAALTGLHNDFNHDLDKVGSGRYPVWQVGLDLSYPLGNDTAKNAAIRSRLQADQIGVLMENLKGTIDNDVRSAVRTVATSYRQIDVTARGRAYAEERLKAYIKKNAVGLATTKDVLDVENDLVAAKNAQIQALVDYANAKTRLWQATGELLKREGIVLNGREEMQRLYRQSAELEGN